jgi:hypothetical protein
MISRAPRRLRRHVESNSRAAALYLTSLRRAKSRQQRQTDPRHKVDPARLDATLDIERQLAAQPPDQSEFPRPSASSNHAIVLTNEPHNKPVGCGIE